ncbi:hypothetical protein COX05_03545 [candidate division WWE3 bacterium CG22_combo_CG10-13_8_21_14_all_39_12]|uniref:Recombinase family protein n=2 Tax=Katanobacteria TaxID=422282 RepID=A0A2M7X0Q5_UNCKA|nr:MAG: hypothetical protein COX05_03545 [candidate division WWE3 bacterium CG22_combo_CG10-13_8_21_14_all_39_12]PJA39673.1 MAG: hypothetical protein CO179_04750 [candidate division WWE3 bacterium CG_4_9_14_3_um_filter_39_7]
MDTESISPIPYCLYARKSSESDERQTMSIDSQIKEMTELAVKEGLQIRDIRSESHSAKDSGMRPVFSQIITDIRRSEFEGILTWAPDRLSRNAGDLGQLVDLMDQGKLRQIRTYSQTFTNDPAQKFLLMILCSQAKLENDQKGVNVKRGIRAKCEMGWRPGPAPIGYMNISQAGVKKIIPDPERAPLIKEIFELFGEGCWHGRDLKQTMDKAGFTTPTGKPIALSAIYRILKNPFYYGEFEYPTSTGSLYQGSHEPLISKYIFEKVQKKMTVPAKSKWGSVELDYKNIFRCGECGYRITGELKNRKLRNGRIRKHIYYHCTRTPFKKCGQPSITEQDLETEILRFIKENLGALKVSEELQESIRKYEQLRDHVLDNNGIISYGEDLDLVGYVKRVVRSGSRQAKRELIYGISPRPVLVKQKLLAHPT